MEWIILGLLALCFSGSDSKDDKKAKERKRRRAYERRQRKHHEDLGYYEYLYGQGHP